MRYRAPHEFSERKVCLYCSQKTHFSSECRNSKRKFSVAWRYLKMHLDMNPRQLNQELYNFLHFHKYIRPVPISKRRTGPRDTKGGRRQPISTKENAKVVEQQEGSEEASRPQSSPKNGP